MHTTTPFPPFNPAIPSPQNLLQLIRYSLSQLRVAASDGGNPSRVDYEVVTINVDRNNFGPSWVNPSAPAYTSTTQVIMMLMVMLMIMTR